MPDKTANWGVPGSGARYRTQDSDPTGGGNFVVAERLDSNGDPVDVLLEWDETAGEWRYGGPVNLDGEDVTNVGALDADSVSTNEINNAGEFLLWSATGSLITRTDPSSSSAPFQDALDTINSEGGGLLEVPPGSYDSTGDIKPYDDTSIHFRGGIEESVINITATEADGFVFDRPNLREISITGGVRLSGLGPTANTGIPIHHVSGTVADCDFGPIHADGWQGHGFKIDNIPGGHFQNNYRALRYDDIDAGNVPAIMEVGTNGPGNRIGSLAAYPVSDASDSNSKVIDNAGVRSQWHINYLGAGDTVGGVLNDRSGGYTIDRVDYEPINPESQVSTIFNLQRAGQTEIGGVAILTDTALGEVYTIADSPANKVMGPIWLDGAGSTGFNLRVSDTPDGPSEFKGQLSSTTNSTGAGLTEPNTVYCYDGFVS